MRLTDDVVERLKCAARDSARISGHTHNFYRYPARFSPKFAGAAIECFSKPGDLVLDPYMGGGTSIVEAIARGRRAVGVDLNTLGAFVARAKLTILTMHEERSLKDWRDNVVPLLTCRIPREDISNWPTDYYGRNLNVPRARYIKKVVSAAIDSIECLTSVKCQRLARCAVLQASQRCLDGRKQGATASQFRGLLINGVTSILEQQRDFANTLQTAKVSTKGAHIYRTDAANLSRLPVFGQGKTCDLVVTSPPYPGVHVLYHRWQVDGRKETPAPYWIAGCKDGQGASFYNFGDRHDPEARDYFEASLRTLTAIRKVMTENAVMVQMVACSNPALYLPRYLENMERAGFREMTSATAKKHRICRDVPNRRWHANSKGKIQASREVVLIHEAV